ncbi:MAG TPA: Arm DNA-binding domain-containing protein [Streptosporangiaceae bacterium]|jgi:hypothetical protein
MSDPIKTGGRPDGSAFYWFRVDVGRDPVTGKRRQLYGSFDRQKDAQAEYAKVVNDVAERRCVARSSTSVRAYLEAWLPAHTRDMEEAGAAKVRHLLRPVLERLGDRRLQSLTRTDVDQLVDWMLAAGRVRAGKPGTGLSARTVKDTLAVLQRAMDDAADERLVTHNPMRRVKRPR